MSLIGCDGCSRDLHSAWQILSKARENAMPKDIPEYRTGTEDIDLSRFMKELRLNACCRKVIMCRQIDDVRLYGERATW